MTVPASSRAERVVDAWDGFWYRPVPPHSYALLRILFGVLGCLALAGLANLPMFWSCDGLVAARESQTCGYLRAAPLGGLAGYALFACSMAAFAAMAVGIWSRVAVAAAFVSLSLVARWNYLPLSSGHQVLRCLLFCLIWADSGRVWSLDAIRARGTRDPSAPPAAVPIWPLQLVRIQVVAIYLVTGLWKLNNVLWRDGSALHYVYENPQFRRFPQLASVSLDFWTTLATYLTLAWELAFAALVLHPRTRRWALWFGVAAHLGMWATLELGPFSWIMLASYVAFVEPEAVRRFIQGLGRGWNPELSLSRSGENP